MPKETECLPKQALESLVHCIYKQGMSGKEALQNEHLLETDGNALTEDATVEGIIRSLEHFRPKPSIGPARRRHDEQPVNSGGANVETAVHRNESQQTAHAEEGGNRGTAAAEGGNAAAGVAPDTTNNADGSNNDAPAVVDNRNTATAAESCELRNAADIDARECLNTSATGAAAHHHTDAAPSPQAGDGINDGLSTPRQKENQ